MSHFDIIIIIIIEKIASQNLQKWSHSQFCSIFYKRRCNFNSVSAIMIKIFLQLSFSCTFFMFAITLAQLILFKSFFCWSAHINLFNNIYNSYFNFIIFQQYSKLLSFSLQKSHQNVRPVNGLAIKWNNYVSSVNSISCILIIVLWWFNKLRDILSISCHQSLKIKVVGFINVIFYIVCSWFVKRISLWKSILSTLCCRIIREMLRRIYFLKFYFASSGM